MARTIVPGKYMIDTAAGDGAGGTNHFKVYSVIWQGFTDGAHTLVVKNGAGSIILPAIACGAAASSIGPLQFDVDWNEKGIETDVLGSGTVTYLLK